jgi:ribosome-binding factor A
MRHVIAAILARGELRDPALAGINLTLTEVRVSPDLKNATAFVVPLGGGGMDDAVGILNRAAGFLRGQVGREMALRHVPRLVFEADRSFDEAGHVGEVLARPRVRQDLSAAESGQPDAGDLENDRGA